MKLVINKTNKSVISRFEDDIADKEIGEYLNITFPHNTYEIITQDEEEYNKQNFLSKIIDTSKKNWPILLYKDLLSDICWWTSDETAPANLYTDNDFNKEHRSVKIYQLQSRRLTDHQMLKINLLPDTLAKVCIIANYMAAAVSHYINYYYLEEKISENGGLKFDASADKKDVSLKYIVQSALNKAYPNDKINPFLEPALHGDMSDNYLDKGKYNIWYPIISDENISLLKETVYTTNLYTLCGSADVPYIKKIETDIEFIKDLFVKRDRKLGDERSKIEKAIDNFVHAMNKFYEDVTLPKRNWSDTNLIKLTEALDNYLNTHFPDLQKPYGLGQQADGSFRSIYIAKDNKGKYYFHSKLK